MPREHQESDLAELGIGGIGEAMQLHLQNVPDDVLGEVAKQDGLGAGRHGGHMLIDHLSLAQDVSGMAPPRPS